MSLELEAVHREMLARISEAYQKTAGFAAYDFTRAFAQAVVSLDGDVTAAEDHANLFNLTGLDLDTFILQHRGLERKYAGYATAVLTVVSGFGQVEAGDVFATASGVEFFAVSDGDYTEGDTFPVRAAEGGAAGNVGPGTITHIPTTISGIGAVTNAEAARGGSDAESDDDYRDRFLEELRNPANGANAAAYLAWARSVDGVGRARVFPRARGVNTVEVCVTDTDMTPPEAALVAAVQAVIDPNENGDGAGAAPMGAVCTVTACTGLSVSVAAALTLAEGYTLEGVTAAAEAALTAFLRQVAFAADQVSYAQTGGVLLDVEGVADYAGLTVNGGTASVALGARQVPVLGTLTLTERTEGGTE